MGTGGKAALDTSLSDSATAQHPWAPFPRPAQRPSVKSKQPRSRHSHHSPQAQAQERDQPGLSPSPWAGPG